MTVHCDGYAGHTYQLQSSNVLVGAAYANISVPEVIKTDTTPANPLGFDELNPNGIQSFYRVRVDP